MIKTTVFTKFNVNINTLHEVKILCFIGNYFIIMLQTKVWCIHN